MFNDDVIDITESYNFIKTYGVTTSEGHGVLKSFVMNMNWVVSSEVRGVG